MVKWWRDIGEGGKYMHPLHRGLRGRCNCLAGRRGLPTAVVAWGGEEQLPLLPLADPSPRTGCRRSDGAHTLAECRELRMGRCG